MAKYKIQKPSIGLNKLLKPDFHSEINSEVQRLNVLSIPKNITCYAVIRTKGGSGERHLINKLIDELPKNKKIFICYENELEMKPNFVSKFFSKPIEKIISLSQAEIRESLGGIINLNWRSQSEIEKLLKAINEQTEDCICIFSAGTSSGNPILDRINSISSLCERIFISVDSLTEDSVNPAKELCHIKNIDWNKVKFGCWKKSYINEATEHILTILDNEEMKLVSNISNQFHKRQLFLSNQL